MNEKLAEKLDSINMPDFREFNRMEDYRSKDQKQQRFDKITGGFGGNDRNRTNDLSSFVFGKVQPQALQLEEAVLGALMLDKDGLPAVMDILRPESFYTEAHQAIYKAITELFRGSKPIDLLTVTEELRKMGAIETIGGSYHLVELTNRVGSAANIEYHARIIAQKHIQRELIKVSTNIIRDAYEDSTDVFDLLDKAEQSLFSITETNLSRSFEGMNTLAGKLLKQIELLSQKKDGLTGVPTGFTELDRLTSGWQPSDLVIVAARPSMGKTAFTLSLARNAAMEFGKGVALFSLEMSSLQLVQRLVSMESEVGSSKLRTGQLEAHEWQQLHTAIEKMSKAPIFIDDTPGINVFELRAKCRRLKAQHDIQLIIIDYLQLMTGGTDGHRGGNREQEISAISRALKGLAKELNVPVIALSQLSRAVETRGGSKKPQLSDLRECVTGDTKIYLPQTGRYVAVRDLVGQKDFTVLSLNTGTFKLENAICGDVWETGAKEIYEIETQSGHRIRTSLNHPFYTLDGWQQAVDLKKGDMIAMSRQLVSDTEGIDIKDEELILLGHLIGDGCFAPRQPIHYTSQDVASLEIVEKCARDLWGIEARKVADTKSEGCYQLYLPSPYHLTHGVKHPFTNLLNRVGLDLGRSHQKRVPPVLFSASNAQIALFLKHLWATDGGASIREEGSDKVHYSSNSYELIIDIKNLLLRFGIHASVQKTEKTGYRSQYILNILGKNDLTLFIEHIGIFGQKTDIINALQSKLITVDYNPNSDIIDKKIWQLIREKRSEKGVTERSFQAALGTQYCGTALYKSNLSRMRLEKVADVLEDDYLYQLANSDIRWERIKSIEHVGNEMTYDIYVQNDYHNFVAENFIIHNSGAIEQDADIVSFIYRPEYYQIMEDENGNSTKGMAQIIVSKHRNGALGEVNLRFVGEFSKFADPDDYGFNNLAAANVNANSPQANIIRLSSRMNDDDIPSNPVAVLAANPNQGQSGNGEDIPF